MKKAVDASSAGRRKGKWLCVSRREFEDVLTRLGYSFVDASLVVNEGARTAGLHQWDRAVCAPAGQGVFKARYHGETGVDVGRCGLQETPRTATSERLQRALQAALKAAGGTTRRPTSRPASSRCAPAPAVGGAASSSSGRSLAGGGRPAAPKRPFAGAPRSPVRPGKLRKLSHTPSFEALPTSVSSPASASIPSTVVLNADSPPSTTSAAALPARPLRRMCSVQ